MKIRICSTVFDLVEYYIQQLNPYKEEEDYKISTQERSELPVFDLVGNNFDVFSVLNLNDGRSIIDSGITERQTQTLTNTIYPGGLDKVGRLYIFSSSSFLKIDNDKRQNGRQKKGDQLESGDCNKCEFDQTQTNALEIVVNINLFIQSNIDINGGLCKVIKDNITLTKDEPIAIYLNGEKVVSTEYEIIGYEELIKDYLVFCYSTRENFSEIDGESQEIEEVDTEIISDLEDV